MDIILGQTNYYRAAAEVAALEELALISLPTLLAALQGALLDVCLSVPGRQVMYDRLLADTSFTAAVQPYLVEMELDITHDLVAFASFQHLHVVCQLTHLTRLSLAASNMAELLIPTGLAADLHKLTNLRELAVCSKLAAEDNASAAQLAAGVRKLSALTNLELSSGGYV